MVQVDSPDNQALVDTLAAHQERQGEEDSRGSRTVADTDKPEGSLDRARGDIQAQQGELHPGVRPGQHQGHQEAVGRT